MSNWFHNVIKIRLSRQGYLPDYPPHLISNGEMATAFLPELPESFTLDDVLNCYDSYFVNNYPCMDPSLTDMYIVLVKTLNHYMNVLRNSSDDDVILPDWVYSYMLGEVISINSDKLDIHDMLVLMNLDNIDDDFTVAASKMCYKISSEWIAKLPDSTDTIVQSSESPCDQCPCKDCCTCRETNENISTTTVTICKRPPTIFGEPHVLKYLRIKYAEV